MTTIGETRMKMSVNDRAALSLEEVEDIDESEYEDFEKNYG